MRNNEGSTKHSRLDHLNYALMFSALLLFSAQANAQVFSIGGSTSTAVASDHTTLAGKIAFTLSGGPTTGAGTIVVGSTNHQLDVDGNSNRRYFCVARQHCLG